MISSSVLDKLLTILEERMATKHRRKTSYPGRSQQRRINWLLIANQACGSVEHTLESLAVYICTDYMLILGGVIFTRTITVKNSKSIISG
jgi:hypothetical protein